MRWRHPHSLIAGASVGGIVVQEHGWILFAAGLALGALAALALVSGRRLLRRFDRALPDANRHPCAQCSAPVEGRNKYCSETCRELAADERAERRRVAQRMEEYGEVPF